MRGSVLHFNALSGEGVISGEDGQRYEFSRADLNGLSVIQPGAQVDFQASGNRATAIYLVPGLTTEKNKFVAALLAFFLGGWGIHKFYLGKTNAGVIMLLMGTIGWILILPGLAVCLIAFIEFIIYLVKSDQDFYQDYVVGNKTWF